MVLALLAAGAYFERQPLLALWRQGYDRMSKGAGASAGATPEPAIPGNGPGAPGLPGAPVVPKHAPPGTFYMLERAKVVSSTGVKAVNPGELVKLLERLSARAPAGDRRQRGFRGFPQSRSRGRPGGRAGSRAPLSHDAVQLVSLSSRA